MSATAVALYQEAGKLVHQARRITDEWAGKEMPDDVRRQLDSLFDEAEKKKAEGDRIRQAEGRESRLAELERQFGEPLGERIGVGAPEAKDGGAALESKEDLALFRKWVWGGANALDQTERKALQVTDDTMGGFLTVPIIFRNELIQKVDDIVVMRGISTVFQLQQAESVGVPTLDSDLLDAEWTNELGEAPEDDAIRFGRRNLRPHPLVKLVKISNTLLRRAQLVNPENLVRDRLAYKYAVTQEKSFLTGDGNEKPLGVFTESAAGISASRNVTVSTSGNVDADKLIALKHTLKQQYWRNARWIMHRDTLRRIRQLKVTANGQYLWQPGIQDDLPNSILELPYILSEFAPSEASTGQPLIMLGDFTFYYIAEALGLEMQRLVEKYATQNATGFVARAEIDGMPVLEEAFVRGVW
ncbi:MAG: phage major capsid protein [Chloroflexota bacterium]